MQRGLKVYKEVCAACHSLSFVAFRNLAERGGPGFSVAQAQAFASEYKVKDGPNDQGEMFERPGRPADYFPSPFPNEQAARVANGGAYPPDLSLITKARSYGRGFPQFLIDFFTQYQEQGPDYWLRCCRAMRKSRRPGSRCPRVPTTTGTFPATPSRCRTR